MTGDGHDGEMVVACEAQIVDGTVTQVMKGKVSKFCLLYGPVPLELVVARKIIDRFALAQEYPVGVKSPGEIDKHFPDLRMNRDSSLETSLGFHARKSDDITLKIDITGCAQCSPRPPAKNIG